METNLWLRNLLLKVFFNLCLVLSLSCSGAAQQTTGRPPSIFENEATYGDFAPVGAGGLYTNPQTGERYNNAMAATISILNSQMQQFMQAEMQNIMRKDMIGGEVIKGGLAHTTLPAINYKGKEPFIVKALQSFNQELTARSLKITDAADCRTLIIALSFEVYSNGSKMNQKQILDLRQLYKKDLLKDRGYQGMTDSERLAQTEQFALQTIVAYNIWQAAKTQPVPADAQIGAWEAAKGIMSRYYSTRFDKMILTPGGLVVADTPNGFAPPIASTATTTFKRNRKIILAEQDNAVQLFGGTAEDSSYTKWVRAFDKVAASYNSPTNDAAVANAAAFAVYYKIYSGKKLDLKQYQSVLKEMEKDLKTDQSFQRMNHEKRQLYYEDLASEAMNLFEQAKERSDLKEDAYAKMEKIFAPRKLNEYRLTENGFVKK